MRSSPSNLFRRLAIPSLGLALVTALVLAIPAKAYVLEGPSWPSNATPTFQLALGNAGRTLIDGNTSWDVAANPAGNSWNVDVQRVRLVMNNNDSATVSQGDHVNTVAFANTFFGMSFGSGTLAITGYSYSGSNMVEADILFNKAQNWDSYRGNVRYGSNGFAIGDIRRVLVHELGHAIGLNHPDTAGQHVVAVMNSIMSSVEIPAADDISGAQHLYGAPSGTPTPTPTPTATPTPTPTPTPTATPTPTPTPTPSPTPGTYSVSLAVTPSSVHTGGSATFTVAVSPASGHKALTIKYTMSGTAVRGTNYAMSVASYTVPANAGSANITLTVKTPPATAKTATMTLSAGTGYTLSAAKSATVTISK